MGIKEAAWQPSRARGQSDGDGVAAAALLGPRVAAQTGVHVRPLVRKPVVAGHRGGSASAAWTMAQPWTMVAWAIRPAPPNDPAASALCRLVRWLQYDPVSLDNRAGARHGRRPPRAGREPGSARAGSAVPRPGHRVLGNEGTENSVKA